MMDRAQPLIEKAQIGFIDFIITPLYQCLLQVMPSSVICIDQMRVNRAYWQQRLDELTASQQQQQEGISSPKGQTRLVANTASPSTTIAAPTPSTDPRNSLSSNTSNESSEPQQATLILSPNSAFRPSFTAKQEEKKQEENDQQ